MKKMFKIGGIILVSIVAVIILVVGFTQIKNYINSQKPWLASDYYTEFQSDSPLEQKYSGVGSNAVSQLIVESDDESITNIRIWYPSEIESNNQEYPLIVVTNGSNTAALNYEPFFERLASWGFIVAGNDDRQSGTGLSTSKTLDYVLEMNDDQDSIFYGKISEDNIGVIGYSQGGAGAINAATAFDNSSKFRAIFTGSAAYSILAQNMGWGYDLSNITVPYFMTAGTGTSDDRGVSDTETEFAGVSPLFSLVENYNEITNDVFKIRVRVTGAEHGDMQSRTDGYMTAWMLYHLQEDEDAGKVFLGENPEILNNANWQDIEMNN